MGGLMGIKRWQKQYMEGMKRGHIEVKIMKFQANVAPF
jgi:hypothetical protein